MIPALALVAFAPSGWRSIPLPFPLLLLWPLVGLGLGLVWVAERVQEPADERETAAEWTRSDRPLAGLKTALMAFCQLHGLRIDVTSRRGQRLWIRFY